MRHDHAEGRESASAAIVALLIVFLLIMAYLIFFKGIFILQLLPSYPPVPAR